MVAESEEVGVATNIKLKTQTEQLKNVSLDVATVQASIKDANKLLRQVVFSAAARLLAHTPRCPLLIATCCRKTALLAHSPCQVFASWYQIGRRMATDKFLAFVIVAMLIIIFAILVSRLLGLGELF